MSTTTSPLIIVGGSPDRTNPNDPDTFLLQTDEAHLGIAHVRALQNFLATRPLVQKQKTALIIEAEKLTEEAQNALLKTLEEPPENSQIILYTKNDNLLLPTILSRCFVTTVPISHQPSDVDTLEFSKSLGAKLDFAARIATNRESALAWLDNALIFAHTNKQFKLVRSLFEAKKRLQANANTRLTIENLLLNW